MEEEKSCESERRLEVRLEGKDLIGWRFRPDLALAAPAFPPPFKATRMPDLINVVLLFQAFN